MSGVATGIPKERRFLVVEWLLKEVDWCNLNASWDLLNIVRAIVEDRKRYLSRGTAFYREVIRTHPQIWAQIKPWVSMSDRIMKEVDTYVAALIEQRAKAGEII